MATDRRVQSQPHRNGKFHTAILQPSSRRHSSRACPVPHLTELASSHLRPHASTYLIMAFCRSPARRSQGNLRDTRANFNLPSFARSTSLHRALLPVRLHLVAKPRRLIYLGYLYTMLHCRPPLRADLGLWHSILTI